MIDRDTFRRVGDVFIRAIRVDDEDERRSLVAEACRNDAVVRDEVLRLLRLFDDAPGSKTDDRIRALIRHAEADYFA